MDYATDLYEARAARGQCGDPDDTNVYILQDLLGYMNTQWGYESHSSAQLQ